MIVLMMLNITICMYYKYINIYIQYTHILNYYESYK